MTSKSNSSSLETILSEVLLQFDKVNKEQVAIQLVNSLNLEIHGAPYDVQVEELLERQLTSDEEFKLWVLNNTLNYIGGGGSEEEEEE